ncbi:heat-inducible transcriptional repressor HrcA [Desulfuribacillus alkaliarsenatis]|uniref:Heat-inducible transcription repressor HrcA n=2 Tax=Desulfuribacillus alkaliarsenatis TaxID=766136 RepID=A0A1E5G1B7_9FIRM|nr:heat-inducible transcriptional repressor HrcA [Desulfuribacillus alkaliarsenatis]
MLTDRQKLILKVIIDDYVRSAEPVGSRVIAKKESVNYSSATIRNEMSDLEELGYLEQPHTSAGRIPSQKGYRYYVDNLMEATVLSKGDLISVRELLVQKKLEVEEIVSNTANILAGLTNYTAIVLGPEVFHTKLKNIQLVPINQDNCVCILITDTGHVEKKLVSLPPQLPATQLEQLTNLLNKKLTGTPLYKLSQVLYNEVAKELQRNVDSFEHAMEFLEGIIAEKNVKDARGVFLRGTSHILNQPEFKDLDKVKALLGLFENNKVVVDLFTNQSSSTVVKIGQENKAVEAHNCSVISANYILNGKPIGSIGIIGPTRLDYAKIITLIDYISLDLSKTLGKLYKE